MPTKKTHTHLLLGLILLLLALALRLAGITWGLPNSLHFFGYHPDENLMLLTATPAFGGLNLFAGALLPHYYHYGSLPFYLINIAVSIATAYHWIGPITSAGGVIHPDNWARAYLCGRLLSVFMGVGTVWATFAVGRRLWSPAAGLIAALFLALMPLHAQQSHFATVDVGSAFWLMLSLLWTTKVLTGEQQVRAAALAGLFAGLTAATKYSGVLVLLSLAVALAVRLRAGSLSKSQALGLMSLALAAAAAAFVVTCPGCLLETPRFLNDFLAESDHVMHHGEIYFQDTGPGWLYIVSRNLDAGLGLPLLALSLLSIVYALVKRRPGDALLAAFALPFYLLLGAAQSRYARYEIPLLPILALWTGRMASQLVLESKQIAWKRSLIAAVGLIALFTAADCLFLLSPMWHTDPRDRAAVWLQRNAPAPALIGFGGSPWFWTPPVNPYFQLPQPPPLPQSWMRYATQSDLARFCYNPKETLDPDMLSACSAPVVVVSEYEYFDVLRLREPYALKYVEELSGQYNSPIIFQSPHPLGGYHWIDGWPTQDLPTDMLYPSPNILIFTRR